MFADRASEAHERRQAAAGQAGEETVDQLLDRRDGQAGLEDLTDCLLVRPGAGDLPTAAVTRMGDDLQFDGLKEPANLRVRVRARRQTGALAGPHPAGGFAGVHAGERPPRAATPLHHKHEQKRHQPSRTTYTSALTSTKPLLTPLTGT